MLANQKTLDLLRERIALKSKEIAQLDLLMFTVIGKDDPILKREYEVAQRLLKWYIKREDELARLLAGGR